MALPATVTKQHTAWVGCNECRPRPVRYAVDGDRIVCFGDELPPGAHDGRRVFVTVHEIAGGQALATLTGTVRDLDVDDTDPNTVLELLDHVSLGRTMTEVQAAIEQHRRRRLVAVTG
jgi:hypothetical protein